jgi:ABC-2 type transport system permease protein
VSGRASIVTTIVAKDLRAFARDRLWVILTPFSLAFAIAAFWLAPASVDDKVHVGIHPPDAVQLMVRLEEEEGDDDGIVFIAFDERARMVAAIQGELEDPTEDEDQVLLGMSFPEDIAGTLRTGGQPEVELLVTQDVPAPLRAAFAGEVVELGFALEAMLAGRALETALPVRFGDEASMVLGEDRTGTQVAMRDKLRPMMAVLILMLGCIAIAGLVAVEIEHRTVTALLVTPARSTDLLLAKGITGTLLGVGQAVLFLLATASLGEHPAVILLLMVLGSLMMAALGMIAGTAGRDFMSTMFLAIALIVPMTAPTFAVLFPGSTSLWIKLMPSWGFTEAMVGILGYGRSPADMMLPMGSCVAWTAVLLLGATLLLRRRVEAL